MKRFEAYNPIAIFIFYICAVLPCMLRVSPALACVSLAGGLLFYGLLNRGIRKALWVLMFPILGALLNPLFNHEGSTVLFVLNDNPVTKEAVVYGGVTGLTASAVCAWFMSFSVIMTTDRLLYVFGALSPKLALILSMTLRYIPLCGQQLKKTREAQRALGLLKEDNLIERLQGGMRVLSIMVTWALENGVITADSMSARGYGAGRRSRFALFGWSRADFVLIAAAAALAFVNVYSYGVLLLIPTILNAGEELKWKYLQSKI